MERLQKILAHAGVGSRRRCEELIAAGRVSVDGAVMRHLGTQADPDKHRIAVDGEAIHAERHVYWLVNKPRGYLCTNRDPARRPLAIDLVPNVDQRVYTVGRLDEDSEGLLLLTNDGALAHRLMHPRFGVEKTYVVQVAGSPSREDIQQLLKGVWLSDGHVKARHVKRLKGQGSSTWLRIILSEGKNREIRRMLARLGHKVVRLRRTAIGPIELGALSAGKARKMSGPELMALQRAAEKSREESQELRAKSPEPSEESRKPSEDSQELRAKSPEPSGESQELRESEELRAKSPEPSEKRANRQKRPERMDGRRPARGNGRKAAKSEHRRADSRISK
jgi:23S rRNA pseudouridine2605 synthase